jgi:hypothetical protein
MWSPFTSAPQRWRPVVESLEDRLTPAYEAYLSAGSAFAFAPLDSSVSQEVTIAVSGSVHLHSGDTDQTAEFNLTETATLNFLSATGAAPSPGETVTMKFDAAEERLAVMSAGVEEMISVKTMGTATLNMTDAGAAVTVKLRDTVGIALATAGDGADFSISATTSDRTLGSYPWWPWGAPSVTSVHTGGLQMDTAGNVVLTPARSLAPGGSVGGIQMNDGIDLNSDYERVLHERKKVSFSPSESATGGATGVAVAEAQTLAFNCTVDTLDFTDQWSMAGAVAGFKSDTGGDVEWGDASINLHDARTATGDIIPIASVDEIAVAPGLDVSESLGGAGGQIDSAPELNFLVTAPYDLTGQSAHFTDKLNVNGEGIDLAGSVTPVASDSYR